MPLNQGFSGNVFRNKAHGDEIHRLTQLFFLPMALSKLPCAFGIQELAKGYFPHLYNTPENQQVMLNHLPDASYYNPDGMKPTDSRDVSNFRNK